jgi:hypothetical protein
MSEQNFVEHQFKMNETINAAIRYHNGHHLHPAELLVLQELFNELNDFVVPRPGQVVKIPLWTLGTNLYTITNT